MPPSWITRTFIAGEVLRAEHLNQIVNDLYLLDAHAHTGADGDGAAVLDQFGRHGSLMLWPADFAVDVHASRATSGTMAGRMVGTSTNSAALYLWPLVGLISGTYRLDMLYARGPNQAIATFTWGSTLGTIDMYNAAGADNIVGSITGISIAGGVNNFSVSVATKNASSGGNQMTFSGILLRRTA